jgi:predicted porin
VHKQPFVTILNDNKSHLEKLPKTFPCNRFFLAGYAALPDLTHWLPVIDSRNKSFMSVTYCRNNFISSCLLSVFKQHRCNETTLMGGIMKKQLVAIAISSALAVPAVSVAADKSGAPTVYGKAHVFFGAIEEKDAGVTTVDNWQFESYASRVGVKGERDFGGGLSGIYKFEWEVNLATGDGDDAAGDPINDSGLSRRNQYVGLKGGFGEFRFGRHDTPLKMSQGKFDQFGDTRADLKNAGDEDGENRLDDILAYLGKFGNVGVAIAVSPGEDTGTGNVDDGPADTVSASISYSGGPLYLAVAADSYANAAGAAEDSLTRFVGTYKFGGAQLGVLWQSGVEAPDTAAAKEDWIGVSFNMKVGEKGKIKAQYIEVEDNAVAKKEGTLMAIGYDYKLDKKTKIYVMYSNLDEDAPGTADDYEESSTGVGLSMKF